VSGAATAGLQEKFKGDVVKRMPYLGNTENSYTRAALKVGVEEVGTRASNMVTKPFDQIVQDKVKSDAAGNHYGGSDAQKSWSGSVQKTATDFSWKDGASLAKNTHDEATKNPPATSHRAEGYPTTGYKDAETSNTPRHQKK
jgi:RHS-family protein